MLNRDEKLLINRFYAWSVEVSVPVKCVVARHQYVCIVLKTHSPTTLFRVPERSFALFNDFCIFMSNTCMLRTISTQIGANVWMLFSSKCTHIDSIQFMGIVIVCLMWTYALTSNGFLFISLLLTLRTFETKMKMDEEMWKRSYALKILMGKNCRVGIVLYRVFSFSQ